MSAYEDAQEGVRKISEAIISLLNHHPNGLTNAEVTRELGLESDQNGKQKNYISWSVLGILMGKGRVRREDRLYKLNN